ncbi:putative aldouronate transport system permease protein [Arthrobacter pascens]|uniref:ABC transporter permease n=1 Tax=Arthrobacter pascens TaxID=1677 RepID=UPI002786B84E|nr:putative aldouronate transport system permease protein [Arthrobacter pascens]
MTTSESTLAASRVQARAGHSPGRPDGARQADLSMTRKKASLRIRLRRDKSLVLMTLPAIALLLVFAYVPMLGNVVAFQDYSPFVGIPDSPFVGLDNFTRVLGDQGFWLAVSNTLVITAFQLVFFFPVPIVLALLLNSLLSPALRSTIQAIVYLPHFFSWVLVVSVFQQVLGGAGLLSQSLRAHGWQAMDIMTNPDTFLFLITSQAIWKDAGWGIIVFLAALSAIDQEQYEAAAVDGANRWHRMWHVTLPALRGVVILLLILRLGDALSVGFEQLILQRDAVGAQASEVLDTFVYYTGVRNGDWGYAAAAGLIKGVVSLALILGANKLAHLFGESGVYSKS